MGTSRRSPAPRPKTRRGATIKWSYDLRLALHILKKDQARLSAKEHTRVFNKLFGEYLTDCGLTRGTTAKCLNSQWLDRRAKDWQKIAEAEKTQSDQLRRSALEERIRSATRELQGMSLTPSSRGDAKESTPCPTSTKHRHTDSQRLGGPGGQSVPTQSSLRIRIQTSDVPQEDLGSSTCDQSMLRPSPRSLRRAVDESQNTGFTGVPSTPRHPVIVIPSLSHTRMRTPLPAYPLEEASSVVLPNTPRTKTSPSGKTLVRYTRTDGQSIFLTPQKIQKAQDALTPVVRWRAHPDTVQFTGLLFRHWNKESPEGKDSEQGFWSRRHFGMDVVPNNAPPAGYIDAADVKAHLNRDKKDTPFISSSNRLLWTIRNILRKLKTAEGAAIHLSIIERQRLSPRQVFYARPYHDQVVVKAPFDKGAQYYHGQYEFWIWAHIPASAIIRTISGRELFNAIDTDDEMSAVFRPRRLMKPGSLIRQHKSFADEGVPFSFTVVLATAKLIMLFGINPCSTAEVSHIVRDVIEGWGIKVTYHAPELWALRAREFLHALTRNHSKPLDVLDEQKIKVAFLEGVKFGLARPNVAHTQVGQLQRKWEAAGLSSATSIVQLEYQALRAAMRGLAATESNNFDQIVTYAGRIADAAATAEQRHEMAVMSERHRGPRRLGDVLQSDLYDATAASDIKSLDWRNAILHTM